VKYLKDHPLHDAAAIAGSQAAEKFDMVVIKEGIESDPRNYTRFLVISAEHIIHEKANKTSLIYSTPNTPGALLRTLKVFADKNINLVKLESRPIAGRPWEYVFYVDLEGNLDDPAVTAALEQVRQLTEFLKVLGSYPASA